MVYIFFYNFKFIYFFKFEYPVFLFSLLPQFCILFFPNYKIRAFDFLGNISYSLYLIHPLIAFTIINIGFRFPLELHIKIFIVFSALVFTILGSYLMNKFIEKPFQLRASKIKY